MLEVIKKTPTTSKHSKRPNDDDSSSLASLQNISTGEGFPIKKDQENSKAGIFLNCEKLPKVKNHITELQHGDLIGFSSYNRCRSIINICYTYKFIIHTYTEKRPRLHIEHCVDTEENYKKTISRLHSEISNLIDDHQVLNNKTKTDFAAIQNIMNISELTRAQMIKVSEIHNSLTLKLQKYKNKLTSHEDKMILMKNQFYNQFEDEFKCSFCCKLMTEVVIASCDHIFCAICIEKLMKETNICPACGTVLQNYAKCLALDNFITSLHNFMGNTVKIREIIC